MHVRSAIICNYLLKWYAYMAVLACNNVFKLSTQTHFISNDYD